MHVTMVKKQLANGNACDKCVQAEALLRNRGLWDRIDRVAWAVEGDPNSEGVQLGARFGVDVAPFFIVRQASGDEAVYTSVLRFIKERLTSDGAPTASTTAPPQTAKSLVDDDEIARAARDLADAPPEEILRWGLEHFGDACGIAFSGAEDVVLIHLAVNLGLPFSVFTLDTGRLHPETYQFIDQVRRHYGISIDLLSPDAPALEAFVRQKGLFSFYQDGHEECCAIRKVEPLRRFLARLGGWATGQRRDQSPATRADIPVVQVDPTFAGRDGRLVKLNPLSRWSSAQVWQLIREASIPHNPLHERGFVSIGCAPCTRATLPGEHERAGRWWWEDSTRRECGLHIGNVVVPPGR